ncbi:uncharacterized protein LOC122016931 [Zingiber officinale]|uniref:Uncharacterized protein n=1 Tax=Zingiber officinale TaxID=94328 RepID=A0A8J5F7M2_ZINOF|nr:uncharacterized protein LOC122016931 [Zingiber officinale]KAG6481439.1 hypothetical protein ZIOFF_058040 [Zingiber officinale]
MGASESLLSKQQQQQPIDEITTVSERTESVDPLLERVRALKIAPPLLNSPLPTESSLSDILVRKPSSSSSAPISGTLNPKVLMELFSVYREWQEEKASKISKKQEEIENKIDTADALAIKLLQRFNYSVSSMRSTANSLAEVNQLQVDVGELKGRLTEVISNCDALCKRIATEGPESLRSSVSSFSTSNLETQTNYSSRKSSQTTEQQFALDFMKPS